MTTQEALARVFIDHIKQPIVAYMVRKHLYDVMKHSIPEAEFKREFLAFRDTFVYNGMKVLHLVEGSVHRYVLSDNKYHISNHNKHLSREIKNRQQRIFSTNTEVKSA